MPTSPGRAMVRAIRGPYVPAMTRPPRLLWAYTYRLMPPQPASRLKAVRALLDRAHTDATAEASTWEGRLVVDERISHILVLCESPDLDLAVNQGIEGQLRALDATFALTVPMPIVDDPVHAPPADPDAAPPKE